MCVRVCVWCNRGEITPVGGKIAQVPSMYINIYLWVSLININFFLPPPLFPKNWTPQKNYLYIHVLWCTVMYMIEHPDKLMVTMTVAEFRSNVKKALDLTLAGTVVEIDRMGQKFLIMYKPRDVEFTHAKIEPWQITNEKPGIKPKEVADFVSRGSESVTPKSSNDVEFCKHNAVKGMCKKGCK